jgi:hypothetical protein
MTQCSLLLASHWFVMLEFCHVVVIYTAPTAHERLAPCAPYHSLIVVLPSSGLLCEVLSFMSPCLMHQSF